jgi:urease accessory protein
LTSFLVALQLADSALPVGRFAHSSGLESLVAAGPLEEEELYELAESLIVSSVAPLDGVAVAHAHRAQEPTALRELDRLVTARKLAPAARTASTACGRRLAALGLELTDASPCSDFCASVRASQADGNLAVVEGALARALGLEIELAVLIELRSAAAAFLSAAVRLDRLGATRAQLLLQRLAPTLESSALAALALEPAEMHATAPELELHALAHERLERRMFMS